MRPRGKKRNNAPSANDQLFYIEQNVTKRYSLESNNYIKQIEKTVYIGFCDQPQSKRSRSLHPQVVAKLSGFSLGITTRWSL